MLKAEDKFMITNNNQEKNIDFNEHEPQEENEVDLQLDEAELIEKTGEIVSRNSKHLIHCLSIIGQIEGHYVLSS